MSSLLRRWQAERRGLRISASKTIAAINLTTATIPDLEAVLQKEESIMTSLKKLDSSILDDMIENDVWTDAQCDADFAECQDYQDKLRVSIAHIRHQLDLLRNSSSSSVVNQNQNSVLNNNAKLTLPKRELPRFDGKPEHYNRFITQFEAIVSGYSLNPFDKFSYLEQQLSGPAKDLINSVSARTLDYDVAKDLLDKAFKDKGKQQYAVLDRLVRLEFSNTEPLKWIGEIRTIYDQCKDLKIDLEIILQYFFWNSLSDAFKQQLISVSNSCRPSLKQIIDGAFEANSRMSELRSDRLSSKACHSSDSLHRTVEKQSGCIAMATGVNKSTTNSSKPNSSTNNFKLYCLLCNAENDHKPSKCTKYTSVQSKIDKLKALSRCIKCTSAKHLKECNNTKIKCFECQGSHLTYLCNAKTPKSSKPEGKKPENSDGTSTVSSVSNIITMSAYSSDHDIVLPSFTALVQGSKGKLVKNRALFDACSQSSFITEALSKRINCEVVEGNVSLSVKGFNSRKVYKTRKVKFKLDIAGKLHEIHAVCVPNIDIALDLTDLPKVSHAFNSKKISLADCNLSSNKVNDIQLVLGSDFAYVLPINTIVFGGVR